jgi:hypothetical protein
LATTKVEDFDRFLKTFSTKAPRNESSTVLRVRPCFRDPNENDRVWVLFDWDASGWQNFVSDPEVPPILQAAGHRTAKPLGCVSLQRRERQQTTAADAQG